MNIKTINKIIAVLLVAIMAITVTTPVFAANMNINEVMTVFKKVNSALRTLKMVLGTFFGINVTIPMFPEQEPVISVNFIDIAAECDKVLADRGFTYGTRGFSDFSSFTPANITRNKIIDCSEYVSWVIYEYAKQTANTDLMADFKATKDSETMLTYFKNGSKHFSLIGNNLQNIKVSDLKKGDIIIKNGHVEIYSHYDNTKGSYKYRGYSAGSTECIQYAGTRGIVCNNNLSSYAVYRIK